MILMWKKEHYASEYISRGGNEQIHAKIEVDNATKGVMSKDWLLLDSEITMDHFVNPSPIYLRSIHTVEDPTHVFAITRADWAPMKCCITLMG